MLFFSRIDGMEHNSHGRGYCVPLENFVGPWNLLLPTSMRGSFAVQNETIHSLIIHLPIYPQAHRIVQLYCLGSNSESGIIVAAHISAGSMRESCG